MQMAPEAYRSEDIEQLIAGLEQKRRHQIAGLVVVVVCALLALLARIAGGDLLGLSCAVWGALAAILLVMKLAWLFIDWRCPRCNGLLGPGYYPRYCARCGLEFTSSRQ